MEIPVEVDYSKPFQASDHALWQKDYQAKVKVVEMLQFFGAGPQGLPATAQNQCRAFLEDYSFGELADLEPWEREVLLGNAAEPRDPDHEAAFHL